MNERNFAIDFIRLVSILGVVVIHTSTYFLDRVPGTSSYFYLLHAINQLFRFAVPLFFAISGFLLGSRYSSIKNPLAFYKRRFGKIILPYFVWSLFYFLIIFPNPINLVFSKIFLHNLLTGDSSYQLYFIPAIIVLYTIFPLLIYFRKLFLSLWFIAGLTLIEVVVLSHYYYSDSNPQIISAIPNAFYNLLPFILGIFAALRIENIKSFIKNRLNLFLIISSLSWIWIFAESLFLFKTTGRPMYLRNQWRINVTLYGISMGALLYYFYQEKWNKLISVYSKFSFGVFFVHVAILHNLMKIADVYKFYNLFWFTLILLATILLSFIFSMTISKVKLLDKLLGLKG